jgi:hypothetical protein
MTRCLIAIALVFSFSAPALAWGLEKTPRRAEYRQAEPASKHHRPVGSIDKRQRTIEESDAAWQREYWQPCDSTFREYIVNACNAN